MMKSLMTALAMAAVISVLCGCADHRKADVPLASTELMIRFFSSMRKGDHASAVQQGVKLYAMDNSQDSVIQLVMLEQANQYVSEVQRCLNSGNLQAALAVLDRGIKQYPENKALGQCRRRVRQLRNVKALLQAMENANNSASMSAALTAARIGLAANMTPQLQKHFAGYEEKIAQLRKSEQKNEKTPSLVEPGVPLNTRVN